MPVDAFLLALGSASLHALWNVLLARERDVHAATAVAMVAGVAVFAPVAVLRFDIDGRVWPYVVVTSLLQLAYFGLLAVAYGRAELSFVYPIARGVAPVLVLAAGAVLLGTATGAGQVLGVFLVALGVILVRGLGGPHDGIGLVLGLAIAAVIASYTLLDKRGIRFADPIVYLELGMAPAAAAYALAVVAARRSAGTLVEALRPAPVVAGVLSFGAYALVLAALARADAASVAAVRETSVLIATGLAAWLLRERVDRARLLGAALVVAGVALLALE